MKHCAAGTRQGRTFSLRGMSFVEFVQQCWRKMHDNELPTRAAAIAYYAMLALVPFLTLVITIAVKVISPMDGMLHADEEQALLTVDELQVTVEQLFPPTIQQVFLDQIERIREQRIGGLVSISALVLLWLTSTLFIAVIDAMERIHGVVDTRPFWKLRLTAIAMTIVQAIILIGSLVTIAAWPWFSQFMGLGGLGVWLATTLHWLVIVVMVSLSFAATFYVAPSTNHRWQWITPGSVFGTVVFLAASLGFSSYVQNFARYNETYGSLGGVMALLLWLWITGLVLLMAAQINAVIDATRPESVSTNREAEDSGPS